MDSKTRCILLCKMGTVACLCHTLPSLHRPSETVKPKRRRMACSTLCSLLLSDGLNDRLHSSAEHCLVKCRLFRCHTLSSLPPPSAVSVCESQPGPCLKGHSAVHTRCLRHTFLYSSRFVSVSHSFDNNLGEKFTSIRKRVNFTFPLMIRSHVTQKAPSQSEAKPRDVLPLPSVWAVIVRTQSNLNNKNNKNKSISKGNFFQTYWFSFILSSSSGEKNTRPLCHERKTKKSPGFFLPKPPKGTFCLYVHATFRSTESKEVLPESLTKGPITSGKGSEDWQVPKTPKSHYTQA